MTPQNRQKSNARKNKMLIIVTLNGFRHFAIFRMVVLTMERPMYDADYSFVSFNARIYLIILYYNALT